LGQAAAVQSQELAAGAAWDVVENLNETCEPEASGLERFVGLEHPEPGSLHIRVTQGAVLSGQCALSKFCRRWIPSDPCRFFTLPVSRFPIHSEQVVQSTASLPAALVNWLESSKAV
jgi:hypothetical protein